MDIKILIATHKRYYMPMDDIYLPVRVGNALAKDDFGYTGDNTGGNISEKNPRFCELTALYWGWKNLNADYIGLAHYRRHFSLKRNKWKFASILTKDEAEKLCAKYDVILPKKRRYYIESLASHYKHTHDIEHLELVREIMRVQCPDYIDSFDKIMERTYAHMFNMCIMKRNLLNQYCLWMFPILFELEKIVDVSQMSSFEARLFGRISELLLDVWLDKNKIAYKEIGFVQMGDENLGSKIKGFLKAKFGGKKYESSK